MVRSPDHGHVPIHGDGDAELRGIRLIGSLKDLLLHPGRAVVSVYVSLPMITSPYNRHVPIDSGGDAKECEVHLIGGLENLLLRPSRAVVPEHVSLAAITSAGGMTISPDHGHVAADCDGATEQRVIHFIRGLEKGGLLVPLREREV